MCEYKGCWFNNQTPSTQVYIQDVPVNKHIYAVQNITKISTSITYFVFIVELRIVLLLIKWCWLIRLTFPENSLWTRSETNAVAWGEVMSLLTTGTPEKEGVGLGPFALQQLHEKCFKDMTLQCWGYYFLTIYNSSWHGQRVYVIGLIYPLGP